MIQFKAMFAKFSRLRIKLGKWFWVILAGLLVIIIRQTFFIKEQPRYASVTVVKGDILETVSTTGTVKADQYATLGFQTVGRISWVNVKKGDIVKKGQAIAGLDTVVLNSIYQQAVNNYKSYQAAAENTLDGLKNHSTDETFSQKATRTAAEVARDNAYDSMVAAAQNLKFASIYAPFNGVVVEANPSFPGANVTATNPATYIVVNPDTTYFESEISETDLPKIKVGQTVKLRLDAYPDEEITSKIESIGFVAFTSSTGGNAYSLRIGLPINLNSKFKVGMEGDADIILETISNVLKIPTSALVNEEEKNYVWVYKDGKVVKREVVIGSSSEEETQIISGLEEGETIISEPSNKFKDGYKVKI